MIKPQNLETKIVMCGQKIAITYDIRAKKDFLDSNFDKQLFTK